MKRNTHKPLAGAVAVAIVTLLSVTAAQAERRPPFGNDAQLLETNVRGEVQRRISTVLDEMAPGQAELKYIDVRVNHPTALPAGAAPGFEELTPGTEFVAERIEVALTLDSKLPAQFRKDLKNLIKSRLEALDVPVEVTESVIAFPTPRPQPQQPREMPYGYPPAQQAPPQPPQRAQADPPPAAAVAPAPAADAGAHGVPFILAVVLAILGVLIGALAFALLSVLGERRARRQRQNQDGGSADRRPEEARTGAEVASTTATPDHLPEVRRALREDRVLARRVMGELLRENQIEKVALAVELVGPSVVEDLRGDPTCAAPLREAAALLVEGRPRKDARDIVNQLHRRILKHRMVGSDDPVEQEFAFLLGLPPQRLAALLEPESAAVQAAALRYAPAHLRASYLDTRSTAERASLGAAIASPKALSKEHLLDVAATLRARAVEQAHLDSGETGDIDLAVELIEERPGSEQAEILEAMRRADPGKARAVEAALIRDESFQLVSEDVLAAAATAVPLEILARFLRDASVAVTARTLAALPRPVAAALEEDLSLVIQPTPRETAAARRAAFAALRNALRARGLQAPPHTGKGTDIGMSKDKGKVVAL